VKLDLKALRESRAQLEYRVPLDYLG
jgi:hypothetical protein